MSAILGILNFDQTPVASGMMERMMGSMAAWGPDGSGVWMEGSIGMGHQLLRNTPESRHESLPMQSRCGGFVIVARARIDNREELLRIFNIPPAVHSITPDSSLILAAHQKWGRDCVHRLLGDWAFAIWNKRKQELFIARDHHGLTGLYYYHGPRFFAFCSGLSGLLAMPGVPVRLDEKYVARLLIVCPQHGTATVYRDLKRLPPAHRIMISRGKFEMDRYWRLEDVPRIRHSCDDDYIEDFLARYREAVRCRLRCDRMVAVTLSGGLDSGSVAALAASELNQTHQPLIAFSAVQRYPVASEVPLERFDEIEHIRATAGFVEGLKLNLVRSERVTPLQGLMKGLEVHHEPVHAACNQYWMNALFASAQRQNIGAVLTGGGGNCTISWHGAGYLAHLFKTGHWLTCWQEIRELRRHRNLSGPLLSIFKNQILGPIMPLALKRIPGRLKRQEPVWGRYSAINPDYARQLNLEAEMNRLQHDPAFGISANSRENRLKIIRPGSSNGGCRFQQLGAAYGLEIRDPTMDRRLLEFCLSIPDRQYLHRGETRRLLRRAMHGRMPPTVLNERKRGIQSPDIGQRTRHIAPELFALLEQLPHESPLAAGMLDFPKMRSVLEDIQKELTPSRVQRVRTILLRGLMVGIFLRNAERGDL